MSSREWEGLLVQHVSSYHSHPDLQYTHNTQTKLPLLDLLFLSPFPVPSKMHFTFPPIVALSLLATISLVGAHPTTNAEVSYASSLSPETPWQR